MTSTASVQTLFNRIAPVYDRLNDRLSFGLHHVWKQMTVSWSEAKPGDTVLDLCCGTGDLALRLGRVVGPTGRVYGVDFATELLTIAAQRSDRYRPIPPIQWQQGDALALNFPDHSFDAATLGYGLRNVSDIPTCLGELHRVLKPGARAAILDMHRPNSLPLRALQTWFLDTQVVPEAARAGLKAEYDYINPSLERFPQGPDQVRLARAAGFGEAVHYPLVGGMMGVLVLRA